MAARQGLHLSQRQRLSLTPALRVALDMLRMRADEIEAALAAEVAENPFLDYEGARAGVTHRAQEIPLDTLAGRTSLLTDLRGQIALMALAAPVRAAAMHLAGEVDADGYLRADPGEVARRLGMSCATVEAGLEALQACEPVGVGARDLAECLALQLVERGTPRETANAVVAELDGFARRDWAGLAKRLEMDRDEVAALARRLQGLSPRPVTDSAAEAPPLAPDLVLEQDGTGARTVRLGREFMPRAWINTDLLARAGASGFAESCRARAEALIQALRFRGETLRRVGQVVVEHQDDFFSGGATELRPLSRAQVAGSLGLHPSTVGRAVAGKALAVDGRLEPLAMFFSNGLPGPGRSEVSAFAVRRRIADLIASEAPQAPFSDEELCRRLRAEGVDIARRTVAKYRQCLRLPSSTGRRHRQRPDPAANDRAQW